MMADRNPMETVPHDSSVGTKSNFYSSATIPANISDDGLDDSPAAVEPENAGLYHSKLASFSQNTTEDDQTQRTDSSYQIDKIATAPRLPEPNLVSTTEIADFNGTKEHQHRSIDPLPVTIEARARWAMLASLAGVSRANEKSEHPRPRSNSKSEIERSTGYDHCEIQDERTWEEEVVSQPVRSETTSESARLNQVDTSSHQSGPARDSTSSYDYESETVKQDNSPADVLRINQFLHRLELDPHIDTRGLEKGRLSSTHSPEMHIGELEREGKFGFTNETREMGSANDRIRRVGEHSKESDGNASFKDREQQESYQSHENHTEHILKENHGSLLGRHTWIRKVDEELQGRDPRNQVRADKDDLGGMERVVENYEIRKDIREVEYELGEEIHHGAERFRNGLGLDAFPQRLHEREHVKESLDKVARNIETETHRKQLPHDISQFQDILKKNKTSNEHETTKKSIGHEDINPSHNINHIDSNLQNDLHKAESIFHSTDTNSLRKPVQKGDHQLKRMDKGIWEAQTGVHSIESSNLSKDLRNSERALKSTFQMSVANAEDKLSSPNIGQSIKRGEQNFEENLRVGRQNIKAESQTIARKVEEKFSGHEQAEQIRKGAQNLMMHLQSSKQELKKEAETAVAQAQGAISNITFGQDVRKGEQAAKQDLEKGAKFLKDGIGNIDGRGLAGKMSRGDRLVENILDRQAGSTTNSFGLNDRKPEHASPTVPSLASQHQASLKRSSAQRHSPNLPPGHNQRSQTPLSSSPQTHDSVVTPTKVVNSAQRSTHPTPNQGPPQNQRSGVQQIASSSRGKSLKQGPPPHQILPYQGFPPHQAPSTPQRLPQHQASQTPQRLPSHLGLPQHQAPVTPQGPPQHQDPSFHRELPPHQASQTPHRSPPHLGLPQHQAPVTPQGPPQHQDPSLHRELPPHEASTSHQAILPKQLPSQHQRLPPHQTPPPHQISPTSQRPPPHQGLPPHQRPLQGQRPPSGQVGSSGQTLSKQQELLSTQRPRLDQGLTSGQRSPVGQRLSSDRKPLPNQGPSAVQKSLIGHALSPSQSLPPKQHSQQAQNSLPKQEVNSAQGPALIPTPTPTPSQGPAPSQGSPHSQRLIPNQEPKLSHSPSIGREPPPTFNLPKPDQISPPLINAPGNSAPYSAKLPHPVAQSLRGPRNAPSRESTSTPQAPNVQSNDNKRQAPTHDSFSKNDQNHNSPRNDEQPNQQPQLPTVSSRQNGKINLSTVQGLVTHSTHSDAGAERSRSQTIQHDHNRNMNAVQSNSRRLPRATTPKTGQLPTRDTNQRQSIEGKDKIRMKNTENSAYVDFSSRTFVEEGHTTSENHSTSEAHRSQAASGNAPQPSAVAGVENMLAMMKQKSDAAIEAADGCPGFLDRESFISIFPPLHLNLFRHANGCNC